ncbi:MAG: class I SAM-dependent methyltransferase [Proteobacteria bacterium]|nr:class I SAM-dependent methyltransferase [Pseudomonadota bacterium]
MTPIFEKAFARRAELFADPANDCCRLFNGAGDGLDGITIDRYAAWLLVQIEKAAVLHKRGALFPAIIQAARGLPCKPRGILWKDISASETAWRESQCRSSIMDGHAPPDELIVVQNGVRVAVDLMAGRHTGLFLDMRIIRSLLAPYYKSAGDMLNLFCYSGVFSVHGLKNGMGHVLNLDLAKTALERAMRNYELNGLACDERDFMYGDALTWMKAFAKKGRRFDCVVLDPPTFARSRQGSFSVKKDFPRCLELVQSLAPGGLAFTVINSPAVSEQQYREWHPASWRLVWLEHEPDDFPWADVPYLKAGLWNIPF